MQGPQGQPAQMAIGVLNYTLRSNSEDPVPLDSQATNIPRLLSSTQHSSSQICTLSLELKK